MKTNHDCDLLRDSDHWSAILWKYNCCILLVWINTAATRAALYKGSVYIIIYY